MQESNWFLHVSQQSLFHNLHSQIVHQRNQSQQTSLKMDGLLFAMSEDQRILWFGLIKCILPFASSVCIQTVIPSFSKPIMELAAISVPELMKHFQMAQTPSPETKDG